MAEQSQDYTFQGWMGLNPESANGKMVWQEFPNQKPFGDSDIDIQISHCGICGSDLHTLRSGWFPTPYPCCVGHEIVGKAVRVGPKVKKNIKVGDRVGVGAQVASCLQPDCEECAAGIENHCSKGVQTYGSKYPDGSDTYGGYADYHRCHEHFVIKIPDSIPSEEAAPMLCGGITVYSPLKLNGCGPGKKVGIIGIGGLGHFGVMFAKALGADKVVAISRKESKRQDALALGADEYVSTDDDEGWAQKHANSLDLIVSTVSSPKMPLDGYLNLLKVRGTFIQVGAPEDKLPELQVFAFVLKAIKFGGSFIGAPWQIEEMLQLVAEKNIKPWINTRPMKEANQALLDFEDGKPRYRFVLVNEKHAAAA
ncbi:hypothetical protein DOTSEDRAFT_153077 [Dothistroma septosporum NZE10]|uniref:alcohol dehydrogenase (NADP(+)) n=1 Tax=Dothistroma septosporum (strain NZE10 / CBS 128990) TaxID=675120 RepID=M2Y3M8_DOTSN|nr:hypothetical protein DOTSEDRAFT_153077 [Dothistroma septosporum NZE10]